MEEIIVDEEKFLASFGKCQYNLSKKYFAAKELYNSVKNISEIARMLKHPNRTVQQWFCGNCTPYPVRAVNALKEKGLMPLVACGSEKFLLFTELFAFIFGDGSLMKGLGSFNLFGQKEDLEPLGVRIRDFYGINTKISQSSHDSEITRIRNGVITKNYPKGFCHRLEVHSSALARLMYLAGAPVGDKVNHPIKVPDWVMKGSKKLKQVFLSVLFGNELGCPSIRAKNAFVPAQFGLHKIESLEADLTEFLNQIKDLLNEFSISTSPILVEKCKTVRKEGNFSKKLSFYIDGRAPNILRLFKEIPFRHAEKKRKRFEEAISHFLRNSQKLKDNWGLYEKVMQLHSLGFGERKIIKKLGLPKRRYHNINSWLYYGAKPLYFEGRQSIFDAEQQKLETCSA